MLNAQSFIDSLTPESLETIINPELSQRLGLYQVFLRLYDQHRGLLDDILRLETTGSKALPNLALPYVQGVIHDQQVYLTTNVLKGTSQILRQPQHIWTIGRDSRKVLLPIHDQQLSRCHAAIRYVAGEGFFLVDLGSSNGSYVNSEPIRQVMRLKDGDRVRLGNTFFTFFICQSGRQLPTVSPETLSQIQAIGIAGAPIPKYFSTARSHAEFGPMAHSNHSLASGVEDTVMVNWDRPASQSGIQQQFSV